jgi:hypothetical protein
MNWTRLTTELSGDPYLAWTQLTNFTGHAGGGHAQAAIPVLLKLRDPDDIDQLEAQQLIDIPGIHRTSRSRFCCGWVPRDRLPVLEKEVEALEFGWPISSGVVDGRPPKPPDVATQGRLVVGVIDQECAFLNRAFCKDRVGSGRLETRLLAVWDQARSVTGPYWQRPSGVGYGRELNAAAIDALIVRTAAGETEASIYREMGYPLDNSGRVAEQSHGTHVLDVAAGLIDPRSGSASARPAVPDAATTADLIFVSLPATAPNDTTGASPAPYWFDAVRYIIDRAGPQARIVINMSVGMLAGPHDGTSLMAEALEEVLRPQRDRLAIVVSSGNGHDSRWSASGELPAYSRKGRGPQPVASMVWRSVPNDITDSFLEVWLRPEAVSGKRAAESKACRAEIRVTPPFGAASPWCECDQHWQAVADNGRLAALLSFRQKSFAGARPMVLLSLAPVAGKRAGAGAGRWLVELRNRAESARLYFDAWIQRDEPPVGWGVPLQSEFAEVHGMTVPAASTVSDLGSAQSVVVAGACTLNDDSPTSYSGRGTPGSPLRDADVLGAADESVNSPGLIATGVASGSSFRMSGTSVAAPVVTRYLVNKLAAGWPPTVADAVARTPPGNAGPGLSPARKPIFKPR